MTKCETCLSRGGCPLEPLPYHCEDYKPDPRKTDKEER